MIDLQNIFFSYDEATTILNNISLNVSDGEFIGILGPNGSGKTTLLKLMAGTLVPKRGKVLLAEKDILQFSFQQRAKQIAVVPQVSEIPFSFSVMEVVLMGRAPFLSRFGFESKQDIELAKQVMQETDVWQFAKRSINELSGGERQRVIVARALAQQPKILLLDEPTAHLDIKHQMDVYNLVKKRNKNQELTIVTVMHDINLATTFCDRIIFLQQGKIVVDGRPQDVVTYKNIKQVFDTEVYVGVNDLTGMPYYVPYGGNNQ
ncbi:MAG: heme ABC transporter ATP-binding protein [Pseudomonadota bacterium]